MVGVGWTFYDVTIRTLFLEHFPGQQSAYSFAIMNIQLYVSQAFMYFAGAGMGPSEEGVVILVVACCIFPGYVLAECVKKKKVVEKRESDDSVTGDSAEC